MRRLLTLAIPIVLGVGLLAAAVNDSGELQQTAQRSQEGSATESTLPAVIEVPVASTTTTTMAPAPAPPAPETTTTTVAPTTTTTVKKPVTTTTVKKTVSAPAPRPAPTTTTTAMAPPPQPTQSASPQFVDCGTGSATAQASFGQLGPSNYQLSAKVVNESTKAIELDSLVVRAVYPTGAKLFRVNVAGRRLEAGTSGNTAVFQIPESSSDVPPSQFEIAEFRFHTAGLPECSSQ
jgi:hypothetical protein